jgi:hypothetical protein
MMSITQIIELRAPQFASVPRLAGLITLATSLTNVTLFKDMANYAIALRVMHWLTKEQIDGGNLTTTSGISTAGAITSESEGETSRSYATSSSSSSSGSGSFDDLKTTGFGKELIQLMRGRSFAPRTRFAVER